MILYYIDRVFIFISEWTISPTKEINIIVLKRFDQRWLLLNENT